jgi:sterol desaturase/sphingolipid hydroxylase (fatty acid hydroxylase superfamily)
MMVNFDELIHLAMAHLFVATSIAIFAAGGLFTYVTDPAARLQGRLPVRLAAHYFPWLHRSGPSIRTDISFYLFAKFTQGYVVLGASAIGAAATAALRHGLAGWLHHPAGPSYGGGALVLTASIMFVFGDLGEFVSHRLQHEVKPLWEFHKVHHASPFLTPLTTFRNHPVSSFLDCLLMGVFSAIPAGIGGAVFDFSLHDALLLTFTVNVALSVGLFAVLQHSHFPISFGKLERLFVSPLMHQVHHSRALAHHNKNYGTRLSIWDWWIGTAVSLQKGERVQFGLGPGEDPRGDYAKISWCYLGPFINCAKMLSSKHREPERRDLAPASDMKVG